MSDTLAVLKEVHAALTEQRNEAQRKAGDYRLRAQQAQTTAEAAAVGELADYWLGIYAGLGRAMTVVDSERVEQSVAGGAR